MNKVGKLQNILQRLVPGRNRTLLTVPKFSGAFRKLYSYQEPEYLKYLKPDEPYYDLLNIQLKGYDFAVLEPFGKYVHRICLHMGLDVTDSWASPHQALQITSLKHEKNAVYKDKEFSLNLYERNIQVADLLSTQLPILLEVIQSSLPEGVILKVIPHVEDYDEIRYIPDLRLEELRKELDDLKNPKAQSKK